MNSIFTPMTSFGAIVYLPDGAGMIDLTDCPGNITLASFIATACNEYDQRKAEEAARARLAVSIVHDPKYTPEHIIKTCETYDQLVAALTDALNALETSEPKHRTDYSQLVFHRLTGAKVRKALGAAGVQA